MNERVIMYLKIILYHIMDFLLFTVFSFMTMICNNIMLKYLFLKSGSLLKVLFWEFISVILFIIFLIIFLKYGKLKITPWKTEYYFSLILIALLSVYIPYIMFV